MGSSTEGYSTHIDSRATGGDAGAVANLIGADLIAAYLPRRRAFVAP